MVNFQPNKMLSTIIALLGRFPAVPVVLPAIVIYWMHLGHWSPEWRLLLVLPVALLNLLVGFFFARYCRKRLSSSGGSLGPELVFILVLAGGLLLLPEALFGASLATGVVLTLLAWLVIQFVFKQSGGFYTAFIGLFIFLCVQYSFHLLHAQERFTLYAAHWIRQERVLREYRRTYQWRAEAERRVLAVRGAPALELRVPEDLFFHDPSSFSLGYRNPSAGVPVAVLSANREDPTIAPVIILFDLGTGAGDEVLEGMLASLRRLLGHLGNTSHLSDLERRGARALKPPAVSFPMDGLFWSYTEIATTRSMQTGVYIFQAGERRFQVFVREPIFSGFQHHPDVMYLLQNIKAPRAREEGEPPPDSTDASEADRD